MDSNVVRIATFHAPPWTIVEQGIDNSTTTHFGGLAGELLVDALRSEGLPYELVLQTSGDLGSGSFDGRAWSGLLGRLHRNEADVSGYCSSLTSERMQHFSFLQPLMASLIRPVISMDGVGEAESERVDGPLHAFSLTLWMLLAVTGFLVAVGVVAVERVGQKEGTGQSMLVFGYCQ